MKLNNILNNVQEAANADFEQAADRRSMLKNAGTKLAAAAIPFAASSLFANKANAQSKETLINIMNYLLKLESILAELYSQALNKSGLIPEEAMPTFKQMSEQNKGHVQTLSTLINELGGTPVIYDSAKVDLTGNFGSQVSQGPFYNALDHFRNLLVLLQMLCDGGARMYKGQTFETLSDNATVTALMKIHSVKTRQAAFIRYQRNYWYNANIRPWITSTNSDVSNTAAQRAYAGEAILIQRNITIEGINGYDISANDATQAFDEPLIMADGNQMIDRFIVF